jgi:hypothetical protein
VPRRAEGCGSSMNIYTSDQDSCLSHYAAHQVDLIIPRPIIDLESSSKPMHAVPRLGGR